MTAQQFVKLHYPNMNIESHKTNYSGTYYLCRNNKDYMPFSEGTTKVKAWQNAKNMIEEKLGFSVTLRRGIMTNNSIETAWNVFCNKKGMPFLDFHYYFVLERYDTKGHPFKILKPKLNIDNSKSVAFLESFFNEFLSLLKLDIDFKKNTYPVSIFFNGR
jgi:hypothetical protein